MFSFLKSKKPTNVIAQEARMRIPAHTPDQSLLKENTHHLLFDCWNGFRRMPWISQAFTDEKTNMFIEKGTPPILSKINLPEHTVPRARVAGSLFRIPTDDLIHLDTHMDNGVIFRRKRARFLVPPDNYIEHPSHVRAQLNIPYPTEFEPPIVVEAWMYVAIKDYWTAPICEDWEEFHAGQEKRCTMFDRERARFAIAPCIEEDHNLIRKYYKYDKELFNK